MAAPLRLFAWRYKVLLRSSPRSHLRSSLNLLFLLAIVVTAVTGPSQKDYKQLQCNIGGSTLPLLFPKRCLSPSVLSVIPRTRGYGSTSSACILIDPEPSAAET